jgi:hypothetical protein
VPDATEKQSIATAKTLSRRDRRRPGRVETVSPQILSLLRNPVGDGSVPKRQVKLKAPPADGAKDATPEALIIEFLFMNKAKPFCEVCLKQQFRGIKPVRVATAVKAIGAAIGFRQVTAACAGCGEARAGIKTR